MKKIFALLGAGTLGVVSIGFANSFNINGNAGQGSWQDISSGDALVAFCNHNVGVDIDGAYEDNVGNQVTWVYVNADPTCADQIVTVTLTDGGVNIGQSTAPLNANGDAMLDFAPQNIPVANVNDVHVLIDGDEGGNAEVI